jgi:hypothetical protein
LTYELQFVIVGAEGSTSPSRLVVNTIRPSGSGADTRRLVGGSRKTSSVHARAVDDTVAGAALGWDSS